MKAFVWHPDNRVSWRMSRYRPNAVFFDGNYPLLPSECRMKGIRDERERRRM
ncbi:MAG TPA: hypothetical protein PLU94_00815 [Methanoregulaceae archaeon]|nr:hypothetical protein [Methanoregulaceae archaeon]